MSAVAESYHLAAEMSGMTAARAWVVARGREAGLPDGALFRVELSCEEILTNVILYAYPEREGEIEIRAWIVDGYLTVTITDQGISFNPLEAPDPDIHQPIEDRRPGGSGIHLVKKMTDGVSYKRRGDTNVLTLKWALSHPPGAG